MSNAAKSGDTVTVHYTGKLSDGTVFDSSRDRQPLTVPLGQQRVIPGFEQAILGMSAGETKTTTIAAADAYGPHQAEMVVEFGRDTLPPDVDVELGQELQLQTATGQSIPARVVETTDSGIKVDANHPLAGQDLTFDIELLEIAAE